MGDLECEPEWSLQVEVHSLSGLVCTVSDAVPDWCGIDLKEAIRRKVDILPHSQRILVGRTELRDYDLLFDALALEPLGDRCHVTLLRRPPEQAEWIRRVQSSLGDNEGLFLAPQTIREDREVVLYAVRRGPRELMWASHNLHADREVVLEAVRYSGWALEFASTELQADREVVLTAIGDPGRAGLCGCYSGLALQFASAALRASREVVFAAVRRCGTALQYASVPLRGDPEIVAAARDEDPMALHYATRWAVLAAVTQDGTMLRFASPALRADFAVVLAAVKQDSFAIWYAAKEFREGPRLLSIFEVMFYKLPTPTRSSPLATPSQPAPPAPHKQTQTNTNTNST